MKSKILIVISTIVMALAMMAQSTTQTTPAPTGDNAKGCACCNHDRADGKMACDGKDGACCGQEAKSGKSGCCQGKDRKSCSMMSKDNNDKMSMPDDKDSKMDMSDAKDGKMSCCSGEKFPMMTKEHSGKSCCSGKMCARPQAGV